MTEKQYLQSSEDDSPYLNNGLLIEAAYISH